MIKTKKQTKRTIDLTGTDGNAFVLIGYARILSKQLELDFDQVHRELTSSDYEHLVKVFDDYFGEYVDLVR